MKKRKKKSNKQSGREIIADVKRREVEWRKERRKERWRICKSHIMLWGTFISFFLLKYIIVLFSKQRLLYDRYRQITMTIIIKNL